MANARAYHLLRKYGITEEQYEQLFQKQGGHCALCPRVVEKSGKKLSVDHNHKTGEIRGLLCYRCNKFVIGRHTDHEVLVKAAVYVETAHTGWFVPEKKRKRRKRHKRK